MNMKNAKVVSLRAAKERKQKKVALVLGGLFVVLLVVQGPRTLKMMRGSGSSAPATAPASRAQAPASTTPVATTASSTQLPESDVPPRRTRSQLFSFELFESKDPFAQQVSQSTASAPVATAVAPPSASAQPAPTPAGIEPTAPAPSQTSSVAASNSGASASKTAAAVIEVNGQRQTVELSQSFPAVNPTFRLVSVKGEVAMIGIAGGSLASGNGSIALRAGRTLTLMNTSDGQRYELRLVSVR